MNNVMKQRLVGALILVALGVVFWPIIFVQPEAPAGSESLQAPPRPQVNTTALPAPDDAALRRLPPPLERVPVSDAELAGGGEPVPVDSNQPAPEPAGMVASEEAGSGAAEIAPVERASTLPQPGETRTEAPVKPELDAEGLPIAWALQVASISDSARADALRADLLEMGYKAYIKRVRSGGKTLYRVSIGPKGEKARLEAIQGKVDEKFGVKSMVVRYYP